MNILSRYFRQLFQIYKYIDKQSCLSDKQKYEYLKIVRSSLTNGEQELLYNDVLSKLGKAWEDKKYMTKYKPIKILKDSLKEEERH